jgi:hypothetical protein
MYVSELLPATMTFISKDCEFYGAYPPLPQLISVILQWALMAEINGYRILVGKPFGKCPFRVRLLSCLDNFCSYDLGFILRVREKWG